MRTDAEQRVHEYAYFLWLNERCPEGRAAEHWKLACMLEPQDEAYVDEEGEELSGEWSAVPRASHRGKPDGHLT
jgi:hypothetical protein